MCATCSCRSIGSKGATSASIARARRNCERRSTRWRVSSAAGARGPCRRCWKRPRTTPPRPRLTPKALHRARISVKGVRYLLEVAKDSLPKKAAALESDLKALQASLGELHDVDVRIGLVKRNRTLLRDQKEARGQLSKIIAAQLVRWRKEKVAKRVRKTL